MNVSFVKLLPFCLVRSKHKHMFNFAANRRANSRPSIRTSIFLATLCFVDLYFSLMSTNMNPIPNRNIASITWKIDNFATLPSSEHITSPNFSPPSNKNALFKLFLLPNVKFDFSANVSCEKIVVYFLKRDTPLSPSQVECRVSLVNAKGEKCYTTVKQVTLRCLDNVVTSNHRWTYRRDIVLKPENGFLTENGALTVHCEVEILDDKKSHDIECCDALTHDYGSLLESSKFSDVVLVVGGHELKAHKVILASRSKVFAAMFEHDCEEKRTNRVEITDGDKKVFDELLRFIYTGKVGSLDQNAADLMVAADKYQLDQLKSICAHHLTTHLTPESVAPTLVLADMHHVTELKDKCIEYIIKNSDAIKLADWKLISESNLELAYLLFQRK